MMMSTPPCCRCRAACLVATVAALVQAASALSMYKPAFSSAGYDEGAPEVRALLNPRPRASRGQDSEGGDIEDMDEVGGFSFLSAPKLGLIVNHLPKCGGTHLRHMFQDSVKDAKWEIEKESVLADDVKSSFVVGLIRNPFEWYVSLWAFISGSRKKCFKDALTEREQEMWLDQCGKTAHHCLKGEHQQSKQAFRDFVAGISTGELGLMSMRFWGKYLDLPSVQTTYDWHLMTVKNFLKAHGEYDDQIQSKLAEYNYHPTTGGNVDCWVFTPHLHRDAKVCLELYEERAGKGTVDWDAFEASMEDESPNDGNHVACDELYDNATRELVLHSDRHMFRAFGMYPGCPPHDVEQELFKPRSEENTSSTIE